MRARPGPPLLSKVRLPLLTRRLVLRPPRRSDVPALVPLVGDWRVARPTRIPHPYGTRDGYEFVRATAQKRRKGAGMALLIVDRKDGRLLGGTGFHVIDWAHRRFELGYWVAPAEWGQGIAAEASYAVCRAGFRTLRMHRIEAQVYAFNARSARVLRKIGFRLEGRARERQRDGRTWVDVLSFGLLANELRRPD
ncbi:MAG: GNAT family N-acetyltransferase [Thermoplasmata archaeon]|nr:GNAT family N-acetyltransferase [Thermoplasmata archaeon]